MLERPEEYAGQFRVEALHSLDRVVLKMQLAASDVTASYLAAKAQLSKK